MMTPVHYFKTQQVADALGVGVSTVKRWVDAGEIRASKTVGRHRLIAADEAFRFARSRQLGTSGLERLVEAGDPVVLQPDETLVDRLTAVLKEGRAREAKRLIVSAHRTLGRASVLADEVLGPVMHRIGYGWSIGTWDVFEEHQASLIVADAISGLLGQRDQKGDARRPIAIGAGPEGDLCSIGLLLCELTLREVGWAVRNLGPNLPFKSLARAIRLHRPRLVFVSVGHLIDPIAFQKDYAEVSQAVLTVGATLIMGGGGLPREIASQLHDAKFGDRMSVLDGEGRDLLRQVHLRPNQPSLETEDSPSEPHQGAEKG
jgi:excisionase family DNA binding protein